MLTGQVAIRFEKLRKETELKPKIDFSIQHQVMLKILKKAKL